MRKNMNIHVYSYEKNGDLVFSNCVGAEFCFTTLNLQVEHSDMSNGFPSIFLIN